MDFLADRIWRGQSPLVIGEADENGNVVDKVVIQPGEKVPKKWIERVRNEPGGPEMIGQEDPLDMEGVKRHFQEKK